MRRRFSGYDSMRQIHGTIGSKIMNFRQIKALQRLGMAHRLVDRCVFSILGRFGQSGRKRKKNPNCQKYATFDAIFYVFMVKVDFPHIAL